ncbi:hypothetical protein [Deinococcus sp. JMULE3]|uniref:hypothetical protein n=1 Tax=Deinococcus sp. JMULE3 TaxID=2518341 RepID=UPI0015769C5B|nr:hypothetical protein [Deinococcus sp. JMULE3]NTY02622.1 hypothetical protein [Deinococcus sp. JMULE3]
MTPLPPPLGQWAAGTPLEPAAAWSWRRPPAAWLEVLGSGGRGVPQRAAILHDLGWAALLSGDVAAAAGQFEEGMGLVRAQRAARPWRGRLLVGLATVDRVQGAFEASLSRAREALGGQLEDAAAFGAHLTLATTTRMMGDALVSVRHHYAALRYAPPDARADVQALLDLVHPGSGRPDEGTLSPGVQLRLALQDAESVLRAGLGAGLLPDVTGFPFEVLDESRSVPHVRAALGWPDPAVTPDAARLVTRGRLGVQRGLTFVPMRGEGRSLALLAYLIERGSAPWPLVADAVLGEGTPGALYGQVRYHVSRLRSLLGDSGAVRLRGGRLSLGPQWAWSTDLREAGPCLLDGPLDWLEDET